VRGELRIELLTDYPERLSSHTTLYIGPKAAPYTLQGVRLHGGGALLKLTGCDDRNAAEELRGQVVQIPLEEAVPLDEGEYYEHQVVGAEVITEQGDLLGQISEVLHTGANDVYVIHGSRGEILVPVTDEVVREIDLDEQRIVVALLPGLLE
jgi:16S rRNA processing protein RimM